MRPSPSPPPVRRREIFGWAMFDFANSSYTTVIVTVAFSVFFTKLVAPSDRADWLWGLGITLSNAVVLMAAPVIGAIGDDSGRKKHLLAATYLACVAATAALYFVVPGAVVLALVLFVFSNAAYALGENLAGAFLPEISTPRTIGRISGLGWGLGYFGGLGSLLLIMPLLGGGFVAENLPRLRLVWPATALFFLVAALPTFLLLRERAPRGPRRRLSEHARRGFARLAATARAVRHFRHLVRFLGVFFVYYCGLTAIIAFAAIFAERTLGFTPGELIQLFLLLQLASAAGALLFGWIQDRIGARTTIQLTLLLWIAVSIGAWLCTTKAVFWGIASGAGLGIGSLQSATRAMVGLFSPVSKSGEFFGFWGLAVRLAYAIGPALFGAVSSFTGSQRTAVWTTTFFFTLGLLGMLAIDEKAGQRAAAEWNGRVADAP